MELDKLDPHRLLIILSLYSGRDPTELFAKYEIPYSEYPILKEASIGVGANEWREIILRLAGKGYLHEISEIITWRDFERLTAMIFVEYGFQVYQGLRIKRYEYDVVASKEGVTFCIDCKQWNRVLYPSTIRRIAEGLYRRCPYLKERFDGDIYPLITSLLSTRHYFIKGVGVIPITLLNDFLLNLKYVIDKGLIKPIT